MSKPWHFNIQYTILKKSKEAKTVFIIFHYIESERLRNTRIEIANEFCDMMKYTVHPAHVTAAYGHIAYFTEEKQNTQKLS